MTTEPLSLDAMRVGHVAIHQIAVLPNWVCMRDRQKWPCDVERLSREIEHLRANRNEAKS